MISKTVLQKGTYWHKYWNIILAYHLNYDVSDLLYKVNYEAEWYVSNPTTIQIERTVEKNSAKYYTVGF